MHFEFLTEDKSSGEAMEILAPKLLGNNASFRIHPYKGIGHLPKDLRPNSGADKRLLLDQLPRLLKGYGKTPNSGIVIMICDLDDKDKRQFLSSLNDMLDNCNPRPTAFFCFAIEEFEAWYLGDLNALRKAYPNAKTAVLNRYTNDSICGTWEVLADAVYKGGHEALSKKGGQAIGLEKTRWAQKISPHMNVDENASPSFGFLHSLLRNVLDET